MVLIFALNGKPASPKRGKGKAANRPFTHPDRQSPQHAPQNAKRRQDFSCRQGSVDYRSGKPKSLRCSFQSSGMFFIICAMDNPSGSAPLT